MKNKFSHFRRVRQTFHIHLLSGNEDLMRDNLILEEELNALKNDSVSTYQKNCVISCY